ncbi:MAG: MjaI family restriction endonuclease [Candidatus Heimdallarchaeaceae archaeon]
MNATIKISYDEITKVLVGEQLEFPKYTRQLINLANQNAQATRPKVVGQMSELIKLFPGKGYEEWVLWYSKRYPKAIEKATEKIFSMIEQLKKAINLITYEMIKKWVSDLVLTKTFVGFKFQKAILHAIANIKGTNYRLATPDEESKGIDGYIGKMPISIKPITYKFMKSLSEEINVKIVYYEKKKKGIEVDYSSIK